MVEGGGNGKDVLEDLRAKSQDVCQIIVDDLLTLFDYLKKNDILKAAEEKRLEERIHLSTDSLGLRKAIEHIRKIIDDHFVRNQSLIKELETATSKAKDVVDTKKDTDQKNRQATSEALKFAQQNEAKEKDVQALKDKISELQTQVEEQVQAGVESERKKLETNQQQVTQLLEFLTLNKTQAESNATTVKEASTTLENQRAQAQKQQTEALETQRKTLTAEKEEAVKGVRADLEKKHKEAVDALTADKQSAETTLRTNLEEKHTNAVEALRKELTAEKDTAVSNLRTELEKKHSNALEAQRKTLTTEKTDVEATIRADFVKQKSEALENQRKKLTAENAAVGKALRDELIKEKDTAIAEKQKLLDEALTAAVQTAQEIKTLKNNLADAEGRAAKVGEKVEAAKSSTFDDQLKVLMEQNAQLKQEKSKLELNLNNAQKIVQDRRDEDKIAVRIAAAVETAVGPLNKTITDLNNKVNVYKAQADDHADFVEAAQEQAKIDGKREAKEDAEAAAEVKYRKQFEEFKEGEEGVVQAVQAISDNDKAHIDGKVRELTESMGKLVTTEKFESEMDEVVNSVRDLDVTLDRMSIARKEHICLLGKFLVDKFDSSLGETAIALENSFDSSLRPLKLDTTRAAIDELKDDIISKDVFEERHQELKKSMQNAASQATLQEVQATLGKIPKSQALAVDIQKLSDKIATLPDQSTLDASFQSQLIDVQDKFHHLIQGLLTKAESKKIDTIQQLCRTLVTSSSEVKASVEEVQSGQIEQESTIEVLKSKAQKIIDKLENDPVGNLLADIQNLIEESEKIAVVHESLQDVLSMVKKVPAVAYYSFLKETEALKKSFDDPDAVALLDQFFQAAIKGHADKELQALKDHGVGEKREALFQDLIASYEALKWQPPSGVVEDPSQRLDAEQLEVVTREIAEEAVEVRHSTTRSDTPVPESSRASRPATPSDALRLPRPEKHARTPQSVRSRKMRKDGGGMDVDDTGFPAHYNDVVLNKIDQSRIPSGRPRVPGTRTTTPTPARMGTDDQSLHVVDQLEEDEATVKRLEEDWAAIEQAIDSATEIMEDTGNFSGENHHLLSRDRTVIEEYLDSDTSTDRRNDIRRGNVAVILEYGDIVAGKSTTSGDAQDQTKKAVFAQLAILTARRSKAQTAVNDIRLRLVEVEREWENLDIRARELVEIVNIRKEAFLQQRIDLPAEDLEKRLAICDSNIEYFNKFEGWLSDNRYLAGALQHYPEPYRGQIVQNTAKVAEFWTREILGLATGYKADLLKGETRNLEPRDPTTQPEDGTIRTAMSAWTTNSIGNLLTVNKDAAKLIATNEKQAGTDGHAIADGIADVAKRAIGKRGDVGKLRAGGYLTWANNLIIGGKEVAFKNLFQVPDDWTEVECEEFEEELRDHYLGKSTDLAVVLHNIDRAARSAMVKKISPPNCALSMIQKKGKAITEADRVDRDICGYHGKGGPRSTDADICTYVEFVDGVFTEEYTAGPNMVNEYGHRWVVGRRFWSDGREVQERIAKAEKKRLEEARS